MTDVPTAALSEQIQERIGSRQVTAAVFTTYEFAPAFFEQDVLPVLFEAPLSHVAKVRLIQLEDRLRNLSGRVAVYYDIHGLVAGGEGGVSLDVARIPIKQPTGVFHAKNVFLLVETAPEDDGSVERSLLVATMSANLTRAGWWENVEACHIEEIRDGDLTVLREDLIVYLKSLRKRAAPDGQHGAAEFIIDFLRKTEQRKQKSEAGRLHAHFYNGSESIPDFLDRIAGSRLRGMNLEVISPFFDRAMRCKPLRDLRDRFDPKEVRVFLPVGQEGEGLMAEGIFKDVASLPETYWSALPKDLLAMGSSSDALQRYVHAKVYRFFSRKPKAEYIFLGSPNLTNPAFSEGGNLESGVLVEVEPQRQPEFWLERNKHKPDKFEAAKPKDETDLKTAAPVQLRFDWSTSYGQCYWDSDKPCPQLRLLAGGVVIGELPPLVGGQWDELPDAVNVRLSEHLRETAFIDVSYSDQGVARVLVQELNMAGKPSLLMDLTASEILEYWALLTPDQRAAYVGNHLAAKLAVQTDMDIATDLKAFVRPETFFDRFSGIFHAFTCLEREVRGSLDDKNDAAADYRLFGEKYDSLGTLLDRLESDPRVTDDVERYVLLLCCKQLLQVLPAQYPEYWQSRQLQVTRLRERIAAHEAVRNRIIERSSEQMGAFLDWFDGKFIRRAQPREIVDD